MSVGLVLVELTIALSLISFSVLHLSVDLMMRKLLWILVWISVMTSGTVQAQGGQQHTNTRNNKKRNKSSTSHNVDSSCHLLLVDQHSWIGYFLICTPSTCQSTRQN